MQVTSQLTMLCLVAIATCSLLPFTHANPCDGQTKYQVHNLNGLYLMVVDPSPTAATVTLEPYRPSMENQLFCVLGSDTENVIIALDNDDYELVLDIESGDSDPGTRVIAYPPNGGTNQQFAVDTQYVDVIRSAMSTGLVMTGGGQGESVVMEKKVFLDLSQRFEFMPAPEFHKSSQEKFR